MTTVGLELTSFIDPSLTWKTVSKGRSTSRRSRNMKLVQEQDKRSPKRQSSEGSEKSNMVHGRRFSGNMEHIPIKKRRMFFRSPSPPLQSANEQGESDEVVGGLCTSDQFTASDVSLESVPVQIDDFNGSRSKNLNSDGIIDESSVKSSAEVHGTGEDYSGIAILAAAACGNRLDNSSDAAGKSHSQLGVPLVEQHGLFVAALGVKENIAKTQSSELLGKDAKHIEEACVDLVEDNVQVGVNKESGDVVLSSVNESQIVEQNKSIAFTSTDKESLECVSLPNSLRNNDVKESISDLPNEVTDKTPENSGTSRDCRLHWDLNTVMDEWEDPVEDTGVVSSAQALEVAPMNITDSENLEHVDGKVNESEIQNLENVEGLESMRAEAIECSDSVTTQVEICAEPEGLGSCAGVSSSSLTIGKVEHCSELPSGFVTSILKENPSPSNANDHTEETPVLVTDPKIQHMEVNENVKIDHSLSLGLNDIKILASDLEDGELREPHIWEDNEGEEVETEHVDYDSDNRDEIVFYEAANDSVQSSGEVLVRECEKQSYRSDNFISDDHRTNEENCSERFQGCLSTMDSIEVAVCTKLESPALKACSGAIDSDKVKVDQKECRSSIEADSVVKGFENDPPRNARGVSDSGRDLDFSDRRCVDSMRRSRSSNFDCMHNSDGRDESGSQQPSVRMDRFGGRTWNPEEKSIVGNTASEDDSERIIRSTGDTSPVRSRRPRIINTSRSGYHFVRRGSPGERDGDYGMGMMKVRDFRPDSNLRTRFGRFNGIGRGGLREGNRRPNVYDPPKSGGVGPVMNRFTKRERSFSPVGNRFHRKSRSRSRTRSPVFRSEARIGRGRLPYQQSDHTAEHPRERRSPPLRVFTQSQRFDNMGSPGRLRSDECIRPPMRPMRFHDTTTSGRGHDFDESDDFRRKPILMRNHRRSRSRSRSCSPDFRSDNRVGPMRFPCQQPTDQLRQRRSPPVRVFRPDQRYDTGGSPVRIRSDECSRPMMRPLRFPDSALSGRGHDFNNNNNNVNGDGYRRKPRNIFERIHPIRHFDMEGDSRRFPYDEEGAGTQNFRRNENYVRRPVEFRGPREERGNVRYNNNSDRIFYSGPKQQFGGGYGDEEGIPRRVRP